MPWHAQLKLDYRREGTRCVARFRHDGPLRILRSLYPEGNAICHNVLVHPPGGLVGGDTLSIDVRAAAGSHGLITTPGATRFCRSEGENAIQRTQLAVGAQARLEWLPLEAICYSGCRAENRLTLDVAPGGELIGWDVAALGLRAGAASPACSSSRSPIERARRDAALDCARAGRCACAARRRGRHQPAAAGDRVARAGTTGRAGDGPAATGVAGLARGTVAVVSAPPPYLVDVGSAYERILKSDVKYRFVIDMATVKHAVAA